MAGWIDIPTINTIRISFFFGATFRFKAWEELPFIMTSIIIIVLPNASAKKRPESVEGFPVVLLRPFVKFTEETLLSGDN